MKKLLAAAFLSLLAVLPAYAQIAGGSISGTVTDEQKAVLPGVTVTIQGSDRTQTAITDETGKFRFLNQPPGSYTVTVELAGFAGVRNEGVVVAVGRDVDLSVSLRLATVAESITVTGESPIIDTKVTGTATNFTTDELTKIPTSRDPFALMRSVPGVLVDRVNIGGNETGQQSNFASKGTRPPGNYPRTRNISCFGASRPGSTPATSRNAASVYRCTITPRHGVLKSVLSIGVATLRAIFAASAIVSSFSVLPTRKPAASRAGIGYEATAPR